LTRFFQVRISDPSLKKRRVSPSAVLAAHQSELKNVENEKLNYKCGYCHEYVRNQSDGMLHFRNLHPDREYRLICEDSSILENAGNRKLNLQNGQKPSIKVAISTNSLDRKNKLKTGN